MECGWHCCPRCKVPYDSIAHIPKVLQPYQGDDSSGWVAGEGGCGHSLCQSCVNTDQNTVVCARTGCETSLQLKRGVDVLFDNKDLALLCDEYRLRKGGTVSIALELSAPRSDGSDSDNDTPRKRQRLTSPRRRHVGGSGPGARGHPSDGRNPRGQGYSSEPDMGVAARGMRRRTVPVTKEEKTVDNNPAKTASRSANHTQNAGPGHHRPRRLALAPGTRPTPSKGKQKEEISATLPDRSTSGAESGTQIQTQPSSPASSSSPIVPIPPVRSPTGPSGSSRDPFVCVWDLTTLMFKTKLQGHSSGVTSLHSDDSRLYSGSWDNTIRVWHLATLTCFKVLTGGKTAKATWVMRAVDGKLFSGSYGWINVWDLRPKGSNFGNFVKKLKGADGEDKENLVWVMAVHDNRLFSGSLDKTIRVFDVKSLACMQVVRQPHVLWALHICSGVLYSGGMDKNIRVWDMGQQITCAKTFPQTSQVLALEFLAGKLFCATADKAIKVISIKESLRCVRSLKHKDGDAWSFCQHDGRLISGATDGSIRVWVQRPAQTDES